jgi:hypothetical protein
MVLNSFIRDFGMDNIAKSNRDTLQGNIVSTFQVSTSLIIFPCQDELTMTRPVASSVHFLPFPSPSR